MSNRRKALKGLVSSLALAGGLVGTAACAQAADPQTLLLALKKGGLVVFMRHGETGPAYADRPQAVIGDCATQRNLTPEGRTQNDNMAKAIKALQVPFGKVLASDFCRSWQTAQALVGPAGYTVTNTLTVPLSYPSVSPADTALSNTHLVALLRDKPAPGSNTLLVSHGINVLLATGYHPDVQGEMVLFRPDGKGQYTRIGTLLPADWLRLAASAGKAAGS